MRKLKKRKYNYYMLYFLLFALFSFLGVGYAVLSTTLNFRITAHKKLDLLIDNVKKTYSSNFVKYENDYYNQGPTIYLTIGGNKFHLLSYNETDGIMRILDTRTYNYNPIAFNENCTFLRCDLYCKDNMLGAYADSSLYTNTIANVDNIIGNDYRHLLKNGPIYWGEITSSNYSVDSIMQQAKSRVAYAPISVITVADYIMAKEAPENPTNLTSYYNALNKLGIYYVDFWFVNSNGYSPLAWNANGEVENNAAPSKNDKYRPVYVLYVDSSKAVYESGSGTSKDPYVVS